MELTTDSVMVFLVMLITEIDSGFPVRQIYVLVEFFLGVEPVELAVSYAGSIISCDELFPERFFLDHQDEVDIFPLLPGIGHGIRFFPVPVYFFAIIEWIDSDTIISTQYW